MTLLALCRANSQAKPRTQHAAHCDSLLCGIHCAVSLQVLNSHSEQLNGSQPHAQRTQLRAVRNLHSPSTVMIGLGCGKGRGSTLGIPEKVDPVRTPDKALTHRVHRQIVKKTLSGTFSWSTGFSSWIPSPMFGCF